MAFIDDLITAITSDASVNALITGGIRYEELPVIFDTSKDWIVFAYNLDNVIRTKEGFGISYYSVEVQIVSKSMDRLKAISELFVPYFTTYDDGQKIRDIYINDDSMDFSKEKEVYFYTASFSITYNN